MKSMRTLLIIGLIIFISMPVMASDDDAQWEKVIDLSGQWAFTIGDNPKWASPSYDDRNWDRIEVPGKWEDQGFEGYDGYAWYRNSFSSSNLPQDQDFYLSLGQIDDADEVYINGILIGASGSFPPNFSTAYNAERKYLIPRTALKAGWNIIAVRVYDKYIEGGILRGDIGIFTKYDFKSSFLDLQGLCSLLLSKRKNLV